MKTDEIEALERNVAIAVKNNELFTHKRPAEGVRIRRRCGEYIGFVVRENN